uniref:Uncharacterized protein n=1 Tax=Strigamia maritima TaxID=126957 RepID=T1IPP5_STRMM
MLIFIGSMWVLKIYPPNFDQHYAANYCDEILYKFCLFYILVTFSMSYSLFTFEALTITKNILIVLKVMRRNNRAVLYILAGIILIVVALCAIASVFGIFIAMVVIGYTYRDKCPAQPSIPPFLITFGCCGLLRNIIFCTKFEKQTYNHCINSFMRLCLCIGTVSVMKIYPPDYINEYANDYCDSTLYKFSLIYIVFSLVVAYIEEFFNLGFKFYSLSINILLALRLIVYVLVFVFGLIFRSRNDFPVQPYLPIFVIFFGCVGIKYLYQYWSTGNNVTHIKLFDTFLYVWFMLGVMWLFAIHPTNFEEDEDEDYYTEALYLFTVTYIITSMALSVHDKYAQILFQLNKEILKSVMSLESIITHLLDIFWEQKYFWAMATFTRHQQTGELVIACLILLGLTITTAILLVLIFGIYVIMVYVGLEYRNECPAEPYIPMFLYVWGSFGIIRNLLICINEDSEVYCAAVKVIEMFLCVWFLFGTIWIIKSYPPNYQDVDSPEFCDQQVYIMGVALNMAAVIAELMKGLLLGVGLTLTIIILFMLIFGFYILMLYIGIAYVDECPAQPQIPMFFIVWGILGIIRNILLYGVRQDNENLISFTKLIKFVLRMWILLGIALVIQIYPPDYRNHKSPYYCDEFIYFMSSMLFIFPILTNYMQHKLFSIY